MSSEQEFMKKLNRVKGTKNESLPLKNFKNGQKVLFVKCN